MPFKLGPLEIVVILVIILMVFGVGKLPQVASSIGKSLKSFREGQQGVGEEEEEKADTVSAKPRTRKKAARRAKAAPAPAAAAKKTGKAAPGSEDIKAG